MMAMRVALRVGLVLLLVALAAVPAGAISRVGPAYVTIVPDGEMLYCEFGGRIEAVRYIGINTPWVDHPTYGRERYNAVMREMNRLMVAYMPYKFHGHRIGNGFIHPWVIGYRRHPFYRDWFKWIDIDADRRRRDVG